MASVRDLATAVRRIERSRETHVLWARYWEQHPVGRCRCGEDHETQAGLVGGPDHHQEFIHGYDGVLRILREIEADPPTAAEIREALGIEPLPFGAKRFA